MKSNFVKNRRSPFSFRQNVLRVLWGVVWLFFFRPTPRLPGFGCWRRLLLRLFGAEIARKANVHSSCRIWAPWNLSMGEASCLGPYVDCYSVDLIELGANAIVSQYAHLCTATHNIDDPDWPLETAPITIEANAWIAAGAFVGPGVVVGEGAVVGARAVVTKKIDSWTVAAGNPARIIKQRDKPNLA